MKSKEINNLRSKPISELLELVKKLEGENTQARIELKMGKPKNVHLLNAKKKDMAALKTIIRQRKLEESTKEKDGTN